MAEKIDDEWVIVEKRVQDLVIELAKTTYKGDVVFTPTAMGEITKIIAKEMFDPARQYYIDGS